MARTPSDPAADPAADPKPDTVRLQLHRSFPVDAFEHVVDGKTYTVTSGDDGVDIPAALEDTITTAAKGAGLTVKKVSE